MATHISTSSSCICKFRVIRCFNQRVIENDMGLWVHVCQSPRTVTHVGWRLGQSFSVQGSDTTQHHTMDEEQVMEQESGTQGFQTQASTKMPDALYDNKVQTFEPEKASLPAKSHVQADEHDGGFLEPWTNVEVLEPSESGNPNVE